MNINGFQRFIRRLRSCIMLNKKPTARRRPVTLPNASRPEALELRTLLSAASIDLGTLNGTNGVTIYGSHTYGESGTAVSAAGDVNGDGIDDFVIGAHYDPTGYHGEAYVVFGKTSWSGTPSINVSSLNGTNGFKIEGTAVNAYGGGDHFINSAGDVNGDGFDDLIATFTYGDPANPNPYSGEHYVIFGKANWSATPVVDVTALNGTNGFKLFGIDDYDAYAIGTFVDSAGDVNGDGFDDLIIGVPTASGAGNATSYAGESYVVFGKANWSATPTLNLASLNGTNGFTMFGVDEGDTSGLSVAGAGDVNGDGFDDLIIGAHYADGVGNNLEDSGESYVVFGKANWSSTPTINLGSLNGTNGFTLYGADANDYSGKSVSSAGDVNGDGFADLIIGAPQGYGANNATPYCGETYLVFGKANWSSTPAVSLGSLNGSNGVTLSGVDEEDYSGWSVSSAGDMNGDGFSDVIIGSRRADGPSNTRDRAGESYVVYGKSNWAATLDLGSLNGTNGMTLYGADADDRSGIAVSYAGDINKDGFADVLIGAPESSGAGNALEEAGESYLVFGKKATVAPNHAPVLNNAGAPTLTAINEDVTNSTGTLVSSIIASVPGLNMITDADSGAVEGIAVYTVNNSKGKWQYSTNNGTSWTDFGTPSTTAARLLNPAAKVRFVPNANFNGTSTINFVAWDQTTGTNGGTASISTRGGTTAFSSSSEFATITVNAVNDAPVLVNTGNPVLASINEDVTNSTGTLVSSIIASVPGLDMITDVDASAKEGIAVYTVNNSKGKWQFSTNNGTSWTDFGTPSATTARLLNPAAKVRFVPNANFNGTTTINFVAWDQTTGTNGATASISTRGGTTAFSSSTEFATLTVNAVNDAPVLVNSGNPVLTAINEDATTNTGTLVSTIVASVPGLNMITDVDAAPVEGIAVYTVNNSKGKWQYSTNNGTSWNDFGTPSTTTARLLNPAAKVRFVPNANFNGTSTINFVAWDQTSGANGGTASISTRGGTTAFSSSSEFATITVNSVNDAPVLNNTGAPKLTSIPRNSTNNTGTSILDLLASVPGLNMITDMDSGAVEGIAIYSATTTNGHWEFSINNGTNWSALGTVGTGSARLLAADANTRIRFVPNANFVGNASINFAAWDRTVGTNGGTASITTRGGSTPFSAATETATITVTPS